MTDSVHDIPSADSLVRVATIGAANGLRGDVRVAVHTDDPAGRLAVGQRLLAVLSLERELVVAALRQLHDHWYVRFAGVTDRSAAEALRGVELYAEARDEEDAWYPNELKGLRAQRPDGTPLGTIADITHLPAHDLIVLTETGGEQTLIPFVSEIVPTVDVAGGRVVIDPPYGLLAGEQLPDEPG